MIEAGDRVLLIGVGREFFVKAGQGTLGTDKGQLDLAAIVGKSAGDIITTHSGSEFTVRVPRPTDFFTYGKRSGAPMLPKDIGLVIAYTGMNHNDDVLDAGTGSGIAAIYFGGVARSVKTYEVRPEFSTLAMKNITEAKLTNVEAAVQAMAGDALEIQFRQPPHQQGLTIRGCHDEGFQLPGLHRVRVRDDRKHSPGSAGKQLVQVAGPDEDAAVSRVVQWLQPAWAGPCRLFL